MTVLTASFAGKCTLSCPARRPLGKLFVPLFVVLLGLCGAAAWSADGDSAAAPWSSEVEKIERCLSEGVVVGRESISIGVTKPQKIHLDCDGQKMKAIWKPLRPSYDSGWWESYESEVAAYRLDRLLGFGMVPPTVERRFGAQAGSLQFWVDGFHVFRDDQQRLRKLVPDRTWSRIKMFDFLINNPDRNAGNILVREDGQVALIDHSRAAVFHGGVVVLDSWLPVRYDRSLMKRFSQLDADSLRAEMADLASPRSLKQILRRRDRLEKKLSRDLEEKGVGVVF